MEDGRTEQGRERSPAPSDAWAVDGFAPLPGDAVSLPGGERGLVETVYLCAEPSDDTMTRWSWIVLADRRLLEVAPRGCALYELTQVLERGTGPFLELVAQDGALVRFEERVRAGAWEARPVRLTLDGRRWRVTSTGTVSAQRLGSAPSSGWGQLKDTPHPPPPSPSRTAGPPLRGANIGIHERWSLSASPYLHVADIPSGLPASSGRGGDRASLTGEDAVWRVGLAEGGSPVQPAEEPDVYFTLVGLHDPDALGLGVWATDICLAFGRRLGDSPLSAGLRILGHERSSDRERPG